MYLKFCIGPYKPTHIKHTGYISGSNPVKQRKFPWPLTWTSAAWSSSPSGREKLNLIVVSTLSGPSTLCSDWTSHVLPTRIIMSRVTTLVNESFCEPNIRVSSSQLELKFTLKKIWLQHIGNPSHNESLCFHLSIDQLHLYDVFGYWVLSHHSSIHWPCASARPCTSAGCWRGRWSRRASWSCSCPPRARSACCFGIRGDVLATWMRETVF